LALAFVGCAILALGIGYVLTHLYRTLVLPEVFYYLTLQFVPQMWRGVFFFGGGCGYIECWDLDVERQSGYPTGYATPNQRIVVGLSPY
jgi:hypothetical protein